MPNPSFPLPVLTRFRMAGKRYVINGHRTVGSHMLSQQYECICISGPLRRRWLPSGEVHAAITNPQPEEAA